MESSEAGLWEDQHKHKGTETLLYNPLGREVLFLNSHMIQTADMLKPRLFAAWSHCSCRGFSKTTNSRFQMTAHTGLYVVTM